MLVVAAVLISQQQGDVKIILQDRTASLKVTCYGPVLP